MEATQSSDTILCRTPSGNRVSWPVLQVKLRHAGSGLDTEVSRTHPADILVTNWEFGKPAALDFTITSALNNSTLNEASVMAVSTAELCKHAANDERCTGFVSP